MASATTGCRSADLLRRAVTLAELHPRPTVLSLGLLYPADAELACGNRPAARAALARARARARAREMVDEEPVSAYAKRRLEKSEARLGRVGARTAVRSGVLAEELTDRELSILRAPQGPATQWEIGAAPFLSINTVKAYNTSLYRNLGVASRHDAVTAAPPRYRYTPRAIAHKLSTAHRFHDAVVQRLPARPRR